MFPVIFEEIKKKQWYFLYICVFKTPFEVSLYNPFWLFCCNLENIIFRKMWTIYVNGLYLIQRFMRLKRRMQFQKRYWKFEKKNEWLSFNNRLNIWCIHVLDTNTRILNIENLQIIIQKYTMCLAVFQKQFSNSFRRIRL